MKKNKKIENTKNNLEKYKKLRPKRIKKIILYIFLALLAFIILLFVWYAKDLPTPGKIKNLKQIESSKILDREGNVLYDIHGDIKRTILTKDNMPDLAKKATVAIEDKNFYKHIGVDFKGLARAVIVNVFNRGYSQGGSTITQQYVKNALLTSQKTLDRKIKELILSLEIEAMFSKDEILTFYLNEIPYGSNIYGIEAASQSFYGKPAKDLSIDEIATLAALPQAPTYYSPYGQHPDELLERRNVVIDNMVQMNYVTKEQADEAKTKDITVVELKEDIKAPHFVMYVKEKLVEKYGEQMIQEGGLRITTTLDMKKQNIAEEAVKNGYERVKNFGASNDALVSLDPKTGQVLAMVGSHDYFDTDNDGQVNVAISERQPGSSFKPIAYATAFKGKYNPASTIWDVRTDFGNYTPENYNKSTSGPVSIRHALANSLNIPAVKILYLAGLNNVIETAHQMGITTLNDAERYGLSLVLGGGEVKPLDMATAFGVFADNGTLAQTTPFLKIEDSSGKIIEKYEEGKNKKEVLDPQIAYQISSILSDNNARSTVFGSNSPLYFPNRNVAAKTGTTDSFRDAWTVGYTPSLVAAVWVGNNDNTPMYSQADGVYVAAPIFHEYMEKALEGTNNEEFKRPEGIKDFTVDKLSGKIPTDQSPDKITDIFASWQIPKEYDDIHLKVKICNVCQDQKLANSECPAEQTEEKTFTNLHSEVPDNPNWENPVRSAAQAMGIIIGYPPTETCSINGLFPSINITSPANNANVSGIFTVNVTTNSTYSINKVEYYIDNIMVASSNTSPYNLTYNSNNLNQGNHQLMAKVIDEKYLSATSTISINVIKDTNPPGLVKNIILTPGVKSITATWTNPSDTDLNSVRIYLSTISGSLGTKNSEVAATPNTSGSATINGLQTGVNYFITIRAVDTSENENSNINQNSAKPN